MSLLYKQTIFFFFFIYNILLRLTFDTIIQELLYTCYCGLLLQYIPFWNNIGKISLFTPILGRRENKHHLTRLCHCGLLLLIWLSVTSYNSVIMMFWYSYYPIYHYMWQFSFYTMWISFNYIVDFTVLLRLYIDLVTVL